MNNITENISYKKIISIAVPIMFGVLVENAVLIADSIFLSQLGDVPFTSGGNGGLFYFSIFMLAMGYSSGLQIAIARKIGAKKPKDIGALFFQGFYFLFILGIIIYLFILLFSSDFIRLVFKSDEIANATYRFLSIRSIGLVFSFAYLAFLGFFLGNAQTKIIFFTSSTIAILNLVLDYGLIFGNLFMPKLGLEGAALASVIAEFFGLIIIFLCFILVVQKKTYGLTRFYPINLRLSKKLLNLSFPLMIQGFMSQGTWSIFFIIIENTGIFELSISHIVRNMYSYAIIPIFGFNAASKTIISNLVGQGKTTLIWVPIKKVIILTVVTTLLFIHGNLLYPEKIIGIYSSDPLKAEVGTQLLYLVTGALLIFAASSVIFNSIAGTGKTRLSLLIELVSIIIYLSYAQLCSATNQSIFVIWTAEYVYFSLLGILSFFFLKKIIQHSYSTIQSNIFRQWITKG